ncbi:MAG TPA: CmcJ/NvfI family oxidoreductase [Burkholderiales bacterium]|nr:CmcJ/NvfI family oxidoreductase [Burkholderiales bacterium]
MPPVSSPREMPSPDELPAVTARLTYLASGQGPVQVRVYPPGSGLATVRPPSLQREVTIRDARAVAGRLELDVHGFELHSHRSEFTDFYDGAAVRQRYYPEVQAAMRALTGALAVVVFDHNMRSAVRAARGEIGVRVPVDQVHNDYTERSGPKRKREILAAAGRSDLMDRHFAFVNLWRPIVGPVWDNPLAVCEAPSVAREDLVPTEIQHFGEEDLTTPRHTGEIYSVRYNPAHRWFYLSQMRPDEVLLLKCYDSRTDGRARFMPHTGFQNPACPSAFVPRESIEARTLVVFDARL